MQGAFHEPPVTPGAGGDGYIGGPGAALASPTQILARAPADGAESRSRTLPGRSASCQIEGHAMPACQAVFEMAGRRLIRRISLLQEIQDCCILQQ